VQWTQGKPILSLAAAVAAALWLMPAPSASTPARPGSQAAGAVATPASTFDVRANYKKAEYDVPMRDGIKLHTTVYVPTRTDEKFPLLLLRTPYGTGPYGVENFRRAGQNGPYFLGPSIHSTEFQEEGFIFVYQDVRGKYKSEGTFTVMRPHNPAKKGNETDESSDTYDTIDWLVKNVANNNGRVGMIGTSYDGFQVVHGLIDAHPALKAASPQASPSDMWLGDDFHHNGAFRLTYTFSWLSGSARARKGPNEADRGSFDPGTPDGYRFFMELGPVSNVDARYFHGEVPEWNAYMQHPDYDEYWEKQNMLPYLKNIKIPVLSVAAWFDAEDFYGPMTIYRQIEKLNPTNQSTLVVGPWSHGGWNGHPDGRSLGNIQFNEATTTYFRKDVQFAFFRHYLKDKGPLDLPEVLAFETGANAWRRLDKWPHHEPAQAKNLYFEPSGGLSFTAPTAPGSASNGSSNGSGATGSNGSSAKGASADAGYDSYVSDPNKPVPFSAETRFTQGHLWMLEDQRFASTRQDVLVYQTEELKEDVLISGPIQAKLFVSSSGTDSDFIVKLIDVYPGTAKDNDPNPAGVRMGHFQMLVSGEVFRAKYRNNYRKPEPLKPNEPTPLTIDLPDRNHRFL
jgi:putative CocE/NonD family hydrolase